MTTFNEEDRKWLYDTMQTKGVDTGTYDDFKKSLNNDEDRQWYYDKSKELGLDVGSRQDFDDMMWEKPQGEESSELPVGVAKPEALDSMIQGLSPTDTGHPNAGAAIPDDKVPGSEAWRKRAVAIPGTNPYNGRSYGEVYDQIIQDFGKNINHPDVDPYAEARAQIIQAGITDDLKPEEADELALNIREGYANRFAGNNAQAMVSQLPDQVPNIDQLIDAMWYNRDMQDKINRESRRLGLSHENYVNFFMKPQLAKALSDRYGYDVNSAKHIAARLLSGEQHAMERVRQGEANEMINRYAEPVIQPYFDRVFKDAEQTFDRQLQSASSTATGGAGATMGASLNYYSNTDPAKVWEAMKPHIEEMARNMMNQDFILEADKRADEEGITIDEWIKSRIEPYLLSGIQAKFEQMALEREMPKNTMDYLMANIRQSLIGQLGNLILSSKARRRMQAEALARTEMGQGDYKPGFGARVAGGVAAMLPDMMYGGPFGMISKVSTKGVQGMAQQLITDGMRPLFARMLQSSAQGALSLGAFEAVKGAGEGLGNDRFDSYMEDDQRSAGEILQDIVQGAYEHGMQSGVMGATMIGGPLGQKISNGRGILANMAGWGTQVGVDAATATSLNIPKLISGEITLEDLGNEFAQNVGTFAALGLNHKAKEFASLAGGGRAWNGVAFTKKDIDMLEDRWLLPFRKQIGEIEGAQNRHGLIEQSSLGIDASQELRDAVNSLGAEMYRDLMHSYAVPRELKVKVSQALGVPIPEYALKPEALQLEKDATAKSIDLGWIDAMNYDHNKPGGVRDKVNRGEPLDDSELTLRLLFQDNKAFNEALLKQQSGEQLTEQEQELVDTNMQRMQRMMMEYAYREQGRLARMFEEEHGLERGAIARMMRDAAEGKAVDSDLLNEYENMLRQYNSELDAAEAQLEAQRAPSAETPAEEVPVEEVPVEEAPKVNRVEAEAPSEAVTDFTNKSTGTVMEVELIDGRKAYIKDGDPSNMDGLLSLVDEQGNPITIQDESGYTHDKFPPAIIKADDKGMPVIRESVSEGNGDVSKPGEPAAAPVQPEPGTEEQVEGSALSRIPVDEKGEQLWEEASVEDTIAALREEFGSDEEVAEMVNDEIADLDSQLKELTKKVNGKEKKHSNMNERRKKKHAINDTQQKLDYWNQVKEAMKPAEQERPVEEPSGKPADLEPEKPLKPEQPSVPQQPEQPAGLTAEQKVAQGTVKNNIGKRFGFRNQDGTRSEVVIDNFKGDDLVTVTRQDYDMNGQPKGQPYKQDLKLTDVGNSIVNGIMKPALSTYEKLRKVYKYTVGDIPLIDVLTEAEQQQLLDLYAKNDKEAIGNLTGELMDAHHEDLILKGRDNRNQKIDHILNSNVGREQKLRQLRQLYNGDIVDSYLSDDALFPASAEEWVSELNSRVPKSGEGPLAYFSYDKDGSTIVGMQDETGFGTKSGGDNKGYAPWLAPKGKGISLQRYGEMLHSQLPENLQDQYSVQDMRNAVRDVFGGAERPSDIPTMVIRRGIIQAEQAARRMEEQWIEGGPSFHKVSADDSSFAGRLERAKQQTNTEPTEAQKEKGNYKKGHVSFGGYDFVIENPEGSMRRGEADGKKWEQKMNNTYGYILGKYGKDGDHLDMFINDQADLDNWNGKVYVIDQVNPKTGEFDEHKVMYGFDSEAEARDAYLSNYEKGWKGLGKITGVDKETFDSWLDSSKRKRIPFAEHSIPKEALAKQTQQPATDAEIDKALMQEVMKAPAEKGVQFVTDTDKGQRVLDEANGNATLSKGQKRAIETASLNPKEGSPADISTADGAKIQKKLESYANKLEKVSNLRKSFLDELAVELGATSDGSKSKYATFITRNGDKVTVRLGNHNATVSTFDYRGEDNGISIVVSRRENNGVTNDGNAHIVEAFYPEIALRKAYGKPLSEIVRSINEALDSGKYNDTTGLAEMEEVNADEIKQQKVEQPVFISNALQAVEGIKQEKGTAEQWLAMIQKNGGLKAGEDKWLGLSDWLNEHKGEKLTKQDVLDFIRQNQVQVEDVNYTEAPDIDANPRMQEFRNEFGELVKKYEEKANKAADAAEQFNIRMAEKYGYGWVAKLNEKEEKLYNQISQDYKNDYVDNDPRDLAFKEMVDKYGDDFDMAFEVNYGNGKLEPRFDMYGEDMADAAKSFLALDDSIIESTRLNYTTNGLDNKREIALVVPTIEPYNESDHIHFGDAGGGRAVAWIRFGETTDADGKRVLVIDEIQSKRHQDAREKGYREDLVPGTELYDEYQKLKDNLAKKDDEYDEYLEGLRKKYGQTDLAHITTAEERQTSRDMFRELEDARYDLNRFENVHHLGNFATESVPVAPFEKNWHELAMKRMLRYAAENDYDKIAWTTGEQQAERYNIGGVVPYIDVKAHPGADYFYRDLRFSANGNGCRIGADKDGIITHAEGIGEDAVGKSLGEVFGKEVAIEIMGTQKENRIQLEGKRIGGEGMKGFYDDILPRFMNKYGKKWGVKVGEVELPGLEKSAQKMLSIDVTPEMKESVMQGQPMFFKTPDGHAYGFTYKGKIYIDPRIATSETPIHEYGHLWAEMKRQSAPEEWNSIKQALLGDKLIEPFIEKVKREYPELTGEGKEDDFVEEVLTQFSGKHGAEKLRKMAQEIKAELGDDATAATIAEAAVRRVKSILNEFWKGVCDLMGWQYTNAEDVADAVLRDMLNGVNPVERMKETMPNHKQRQLDIINRTNPMTDDYHTGIRSVDDIRTFEEAYEEGKKASEEGGWDEYASYPDITNDMIEKARKTGQITIYSSYPIKDGVFVTPSRMQASDYAGEGRVYSKRIPVDEVAWINLDEGQYAKTEKAREQLVGRKGAEKADEADESSERIRTLGVAKDATKAGMNPKAIKLATGWEKGKDGKWRYEIPDADVDVLTPFDKIYESQKSEGIENPLFVLKLRKLLGEDNELFKYYPEMKRVDVLFDDTMDESVAGSADGENITINSRLAHRFDNHELDNESMYGTLLHEVQHIIQAKEGFAQGGNLYTSTTEAGLNAIVNKKKQQQARIKQEIDSNETYLKTDEDLEFAAMLDGRTVEDERKHLQDENMRLAGEYDQISMYIDQIQHTKSPSMTDARDLYRRLAGEVESRNVTNRMGMTDEQRRKSLASETEDVPREEQVVIMGYPERESRQENENNSLKFQRVSPESELTPENEQYWKQWDAAMKKWKERNALPMDAQEPTERPAKNPDESMMDYVLRLSNYNREKALWQTAPKLEDYHLVRDDKKFADEAHENEKRYPDSEHAKRWRIATDLARIRHAMSRQKAYDKATVKAVTDFAQDFMKMGFGDNLRRGEMERMLSAVKNASGAKDIKKHVDTIMNLLVDNQLRNLDQQIVKLSSIKELRQTAQGVERQGKLELKGQKMIQSFREARESRMTVDEIKERMAEVMENIVKHPDSDDMWEQEYEGLVIALQYAENIDGSRQEFKALDDEYKDAVKSYKESGRSYQAQQELLESLDKAMLENKMERIGSFGDIIGRLEGNIAVSIEGAKEFLEREKQRVKHIQEMANFDLAGKDMGAQRKDTKGKPANFFLQPLATFEQMLRQFGARNANGEGYLYNYFMRNWMDATDKAYLGEKQAKDELDEKAREVFGDKVKRWSDLYKIVMGLPTMDVEVADQGDKKTFTLTQGNLLYIYMANKMNDGAMKLRKMGIDEETVERIKDFLDPRLVQLGDWLQDEYLPGKRVAYNKVHERMFGAPMAAIDHYFPIKILGDARVQEQDVNVPDSETLPSTITGNIIKRRKNALPLDILNTDALSLAIEHIEDMEHWAAQAEWNRDVNALLSYTTFRNKVKNMKTIYGSGDALWNTFKDAAKMAAGTYNTSAKSGHIDKTISNIAKGVTAAKIAFRVYTAFKQTLSAPAFLHDVDLGKFAKYSVNPYGSWKWAMENMPVFRKRWESRQVGDTRLMDDPTDWKMWKNDVVQLASRWGMSPNALVDGVTCAVGARAIYESRLEKYQKMGVDEETARKRALQDAEIGYNLTQQSSEGAFVSAIQKDRTVAANMLSVFRNSSMAYTRQWVDASRNLKHRMQKGYKEDSIGFMQKQFEEQFGMDEEQARQLAEAEYARAGRHDFARLLNMMFGVTIAWNLGASLPYLLIGDDDDTKEEMLKDAILKGMIAGPSEGFAAGNLFSDFIGRTFASEETRKTLSDEGVGAAFDAALKQGGDFEINPLPLMSDIQGMIGKLGYDKYAALQDIFNICMQSAVGVNPQTFTDMFNAIMDYAAPGWDGTKYTWEPENMLRAKELALFIMRLANAPTSSWRNKYIDELGMDVEDAKKLSYDEMAKRYAHYKHWKDAPITGWLRGEEGRQEKIEKIRKQFDKAYQERMDRQPESELQKTFDDTSDADIRKQIAKLKAKRMEAEDAMGTTSSKDEQTKQAVAYYASHRTWQDMLDDLELEVAIRKLPDGDKKRKKLEKYNKKIKDLRNSLGRNAEEDSKRMESIRKERDEAIKVVHEEQ